MLVRVDELSEKEFQKSIRRTVHFWEKGADHNDLNILPLTDRENLRARFLEHKISPQFFYIPSDFFLNEKTFLVPREKTGWKSIDNVFSYFLPKVGILSILPHPRLSISHQVYMSMRAHGLPSIHAQPSNTRMAVEILRQLKPEGVLAMARDARALESAVTKSGIEPSIRFWHIVVPSEKTDPFFPTLGIACRDLHIFPGVSVAVQCPGLGAEGEGEYHPSESYVWEGDNGIVLATSLADVPLPILRFKVCSGELKEEPCVCGKKWRLIRKISI